MQQLRALFEHAAVEGSRRKTWRITVKRERSADGRAPEGEVSSWLHAHARPGDIVKVSLPFGDLAVPEGDSPLLLASAGIGITPMLSILDHLADASSGRRVTVVHADRSPAHHAHRLELDDLVGRLPHATPHLWYESPQEPVQPRVRRGRADVTRLTLPEHASAFLCGPPAFMQGVRGDLLTQGLSPKDIRYEVFGPDLWLSE
ncbi:hypothetical protein GCM10010294_35790 [Streptomyces griseoloalbus]|uniref:hypothetical protein n=1 Tax=Streptomyces griseoloalbus TaxID=67303 RepID=UPI0019CCD29E|nr:hypothetical protein GCM10010294_35790 [Streptomyces griseoloalbus]